MNAGLAYHWTCSHTKPILNTTCGNLFEEETLLQFSNSNLQIITLYPRSSAVAIIGTQAQITMTITKDTRIASTAVLVDILSSLNPTISLSSTFSLSNYTNLVNRGQILLIIANIKLSTTTTNNNTSLANATWILLSSNNAKSTFLNLSSIAFTPLTNDLFQQSQLLYLKMSTGNFIGGLQYSFSLTVQQFIQQKSYETSALIIIQVNNPPLPGRFLVSPTEGIALIDIFSFYCNAWQSANLPLTYQFAYLSNAGNIIALTSISEKTYQSFPMIFGGLAANDYQVTCYAMIYDSYYANTTTTAITVIKDQASALTANQQSSSLSSNSNYLNQSISIIDQVTNNVNLLQKTIAMTTAIMNNAVNCSLAPNCSSLNRQHCYRVVHTCGPCLSSNYIGNTGESNDYCYVSLAAWKQAQQHQQQHQQQNVIPKACSGNCSGHGHCIYQSLVTTPLSSTLSHCDSTDITCIATCVCDIGYQLSTICDVSDTQIQQQRIYRESLLTGLSKLLTYEEVSSPSISNWIYNLNEITSISNELSTSSISIALTIANSITNILNGGGAQSSSTSSSQQLLSLIPSNNIDGILQSINSIATSVVLSSSSSITSSSSSTIVKHNNSSSLAATVQSVVESYSIIKMNSMVPNEPPIEMITNNIRASLRVIDATVSNINDNNDNKQVILPQTALEEALSVQTTEVTLPSFTSKSSSSSNNNNNNNNSQALQIAITSISNAVYANTFDSNPLSLSFSSLPASCSNSSSTASSLCAIKMILQRSQFAYSNPTAAQTTIIKRNFTCFNNDFSNHSIYCSHFDKNFTMQCSGKAEILTLSCPISHQQPSCQQLIGLTAHPTVNCEMIAFTVTNITCLCTLKPATRRTLLSSSNTTQVGAVRVSLSYVSMLSTIWENFQHTTTSVEDLNAHNTLDTGREALIILGTLLVTMIVMLFSAYYVDRQTEQKISSDEKNNKNMKDYALKTFNNNKSSSFMWKLSSSDKMKVIPGDNEAKSPNNNRATMTVSQLAEDALPSIFQSSLSWSKKILTEMKRHHRWFAIIYVYSPDFPRFLRVLSLLTNILVMLFVQSLTYVYTAGDDGTCATYTTEQDCVAPRSVYAAGAAKCYWTSNTKSQNGGSCDYLQPTNRMEVILFVAIFSALISSPLALVADRIIVNVLAAPTLSSSSSDAKKENGSNVRFFTSLFSRNRSSSDNDFDDSSADNTIRKKMVLSVLPISPVSNSRKKHIRSTRVNPSNDTYNNNTMFHHIAAISKLEQLSQELKDYRDYCLQNDSSQRNEFNRMWGLDEKGEFFTKRELAEEHSTISKRIIAFLCCLPFIMKEYSLKKTILSELEEIEYQISQERIIFNQKEEEKEKEKDQLEIDKRLLYLFQNDLLPGISELLLENKISRDNRSINKLKKTKRFQRNEGEEGEDSEEGYSLTFKILCWCLLLGMNSGMYFYLYLFAIQQNSNKQTAWGQSFAIWLVLEILFVSSFSVLMIHVFLPWMLFHDIQQIQQKLLNNLTLYYRNMQSRQQSSSSSSSDKKYRLPIKEEGEEKKSEMIAVKKKNKNQKKQRNREIENEKDEDEEKNNNYDNNSMTSAVAQFNAANYFYLSVRLANDYLEQNKDNNNKEKDNKENIAKFVASFVTPWPKKSYSETTSFYYQQYQRNYQDISKEYDQTSRAFYRSFSIILLFFLGNFLTVPIPVQDFITQTVVTSLTGGVLYAHLQLYKLNPLLIIVLPILVIGFIIYFFWIRSEKRRNNMKMNSGNSITIDQLKPMVTAELDTVPVVVNAESQNKLQLLNEKAKKKEIKESSISLEKKKRNIKNEKRKVNNSKSVENNNKEEEKKKLNDVKTTVVTAETTTTKQNNANNNKPINRKQSVQQGIALVSQLELMMKEKEERKRKAEKKEREEKRKYSDSSSDNDRKKDSSSILPSSYHILSNELNRQKDFNDDDSEDSYSRRKQQQNDYGYEEQADTDNRNQYDRLQRRRSSEIDDIDEDDEYLNNLHKPLSRSQSQDKYHHHNRSLSSSSSKSSEREREREKGQSLSSSGEKEENRYQRRRSSSNSSRSNSDDDNDDRYSNDNREQHEEKDWKEYSDNEEQDDNQEHRNDCNGSDNYERESEHSEDRGFDDEKEDEEEDRRRGGNRSRSSSDNSQLENDDDDDYDDEIEEERSNDSSVNYQDHRNGTKDQLSSSDHSRDEISSSKQDDDDSNDSQLENDDDYYYSTPERRREYGDDEIEGERSNDSSEHLETCLKE